MSHAEKMFDESANQFDRAYWQGVIDGEAAERKRIIMALSEERNQEFERWMIRHLDFIFGKKERGENK